MPAAATVASLTLAGPASTWASPSASSAPEYTGTFLSLQILHTKALLYTSTKLHMYSPTYYTEVPSRWHWDNTLDLSYHGIIKVLYNKVLDWCYTTVQMFNVFLLDVNNNSKNQRLCKFGPKYILDCRLTDCILPPCGHSTHYTHDGPACNANNTAFEAVWSHLVIFRQYHWCMSCYLQESGGPFLQGALAHPGLMGTGTTQGEKRKGGGWEMEGHKERGRRFSQSHTPSLGFASDRSMLKCNGYILLSFTCHEFAWITCCPRNVLVNFVIVT